MRAVTDTHALLWYLLADPRLSETARSVFDEAVSTGNPVGVPAICLVEIVYLVEKLRIPESALSALQRELSKPDSVLAVIPLDDHIALSVRQIDRTVVPELPDRVIAATALHLGVPLITRDHEIRASNVETIW